MIDYIVGLFVLIMAITFAAFVGCCIHDNYENRADCHARNIPLAACEHWQKGDFSMEIKK